MEQIKLIPRTEEEGVFPQRVSDGFISALILCDAVNKNLQDYLDLQETKEFLEELAKSESVNQSDLVEVISSGSMRGTWVHPLVAVNLGQWLSPKFAVAVSKWVREWQTGQSLVKGVMPAHIERYTQNRDKIPSTHFSMLNEVTLGLFAPLEAEGCTIPESIMPDISAGKGFCKYLKDKGIDTSSFRTYKHSFPDGRKDVEAKLYPLSLLPEFRRYFHDEWLKNKAKTYFKGRHESALPHIQKMLSIR